MLLDCLLRDDPLADKDINQTLERLGILLWQQIVVHGHSHEVDEATIQLEVSSQMPEWVLVMVMVEVGIASEHLFDDAFDVVVEILVESGGFANPVISAACQLIQRLSEAGRACCNGRAWGG